MLLPVRATQLALGLVTAGVLTATAVTPANAATTTDFTSTRSACPKDFGSPHVGYLKFSRPVDGITTIGKIAVYIKLDQNTPRYCMVIAGLKNGQLPKGAKVNSIAQQWMTSGGDKSKLTRGLDKSARGGVRSKIMTHSTKQGIRFGGVIQYKSKSGKLHESNVNWVTIRKSDPDLKR